MENGEIINKESMLYELADVIMANEKAEAEAVKGYNKQLELICSIKVMFPEQADFFNKLEAATQEKIQDELSHGNSLYAEYTTLTGIAPKED